MTREGMGLESNSDKMRIWQGAGKERRGWEKEGGRLNCQFDASGVKGDLAAAQISGPSDWVISRVTAKLRYSERTGLRVDAEQGLLQGLWGPGHAQQKQAPRRYVWTLGMGVGETVILTTERGGIHHYLPTHLGPLSPSEFLEDRRGP